MTSQLSLVAGILSTVLFAVSNVPMLVKAFRTRDLRSYSPTQIALSNIGNAVHWVYILGLPAGPIWILHGFYTISTALMLIGYLRSVARPRPDDTAWRSAKGTLRGMLAGALEE
jgi:hypothetical protein